MMRKTMRWVVPAAVVAFAVAACAESPTAVATMSTASVADAKENGCQGLDNARSRGADPKSSIPCGPFSVTPTEVTFAAGSSELVTITITNHSEPIGYPAGITTEIASGDYFVHYRTDLGTCGALLQGQSCTFVIQRRLMEPFSVAAEFYIMLGTGPGAGSYSVPMRLSGQ